MFKIENNFDFEINKTLEELMFRSCDKITIRHNVQKYFVKLLGFSICGF